MTRVILCILYFVTILLSTKAWHLVAENGFDDKNAMQMTEGDTVGVHFTCNFTLSDLPLSLKSEPSDAEIFAIDGENHHEVLGNGNFSVTLKALFLGRAELNIYVNKSVDNSRQDSGSTWYRLNVDYDVVVKRKDEPINTVFTAIVIILVCIANVAMGCKTDLQVVKATLKKPIAPVTGIMSQFILMPMVSMEKWYTCIVIKAVFTGTTSENTGFTWPLYIGGGGQGKR